MTAPRIALVVLALIAILFYAGIGIGMSGEGSGDADVGWVESLGGMLTRGVDLDDVKSTCLDAKSGVFTLEAGATCTAAVPPVEDGTRRLDLTLKTGTKVALAYTAPAEHEKIDDEDQSAAQKGELEAKKDRGVVVLKEGGTVSLTCTAPEKTRCEVVVK